VLKPDKAEPMGGHAIHSEETLVSLFSYYLENGCSNYSLVTVCWALWGEHGEQILLDSYRIDVVFTCVLLLYESVGYKSVSILVIKR